MNLAQQLTSLSAQEVEFKGVKLKLRVAPLDLWVQRGDVPLYYQSEYLSAIGGKTEQPDLTSAQAIQKGRDDLAFKEKAIRYCLIDPPLTAENAEKKEGEITFEEIQAIEDLYEFLWAFAIYRGKVSTIKTKGGEINADDLATFRQEQGQPVSDSSNGGAVLDASVNIAGAVG